MSITPIVKHLVSEQSNADSPTRSDDGPTELTLADIKQAAREGATQALAEYHHADADGEVENDQQVENEDDVADDRDGSQSQGRSLKRVILLGLAAAYLLRRRRNRTQSNDTQ